MKASIRKNKLKKGFSYTVFIDYGIVNGQRKREPLETFTTRASAESYKSKVQSQIDNNAFTSIPDITFSEAIDIWMQNYVTKELEDSTAHGYGVINNKYLKPCLGHLPFKIFNSTSTISIINDYYSYLMFDLCKEKNKNGKCKRNLSYSSVEHHKAQISGILSYFMREGKLDRNICLSTSIPKLDKTKDIVIENIEDMDEDEIFEEYDEGPTVEQAIVILNLFMNTEMMLPVALAMFLGLRRSEALGILKTKLDKKKQKVKIKYVRLRVGKKIIFKKRTKNKPSDRIIYIPKILLQIIELDEKRQENNRQIYGDLYFESKFLCVMDNGMPIDPDYVSSTFEKKLGKYIAEQKEKDKDFEFPKVTYHTLRHLNIHALLENGAVLSEVQRNAGHSDIHTTIKYDYGSNKGKRSIADKTDEIFNDQKLIGIS